jgi:hypothetical protein
MPTGFPDFPMYPCSRLTQVELTGPLIWEGIWETTDSLDQIRTFYVAKLNEGDLQCGFPATAGQAALPCAQLILGGYVFNAFRKNNTGRSVNVQVFPPNASGVTKIEAAVT